MFKYYSPIRLAYKVFLLGSQRIGGLWRAPVDPGSLGDVSGDRTSLCSRLQIQVPNMRGLSCLCANHFFLDSHYMGVGRLQGPAGETDSETSKCLEVCMGARLV